MVVLVAMAAVGQDRLMVCKQVELKHDSKVEIVLDDKTLIMSVPDTNLMDKMTVVEDKRLLLELLGTNFQMRIGPWD